MSDIAKRLERAEKYLQKGKQEPALEEFLGALKEDPRNDNVRQTAADPQQNIMPALIAAAHAYATLGEITDVLRSVFGVQAFSTVV